MQMEALATEDSVGPNAILQTAESLRRLSADSAERVFAAAELLPYLAHPPTHMVDAREACALFSALRRALPSDSARAVARDAGRRTADYVSRHRIPRLARLALQLLPARPAAELLLAAIAKHSWTFAGSAQISTQVAPRCVISIWSNPLTRGEQAAGPVCEWHCAVFERLFATLVHPAAKVRETNCCAAGDPLCRFEIDWTATAA